MKRKNFLITVLLSLIAALLVYLAFFKNQTPQTIINNQNTQTDTPDAASWNGPGFYYGIWFGTAIAYTTWVGTSYHDHYHNHYHHDGGNRHGHDGHHGGGGHGGRPARGGGRK